MTQQEQHIINLIKNKILNKNPNAKIILFGSRARGDADNDSDWDILILLNKPDVNRNEEKEYREELFDVELETGEPISTFVFSEPEWESKYKVTPFYQSIKRDGIYLT